MPDVEQDWASWATVALTFVLVLVTAYYAWQNHQMVKEMRESRRLGVRPSFGVDLRFLGAGFGVVSVGNFGLGAAFDVDIELRFEPLDAARAPEVRRWRKGIVAPREEHRFYAHDDSGDVIGIDALVERVRCIRILGTATDGLGNPVAVDDRLQDLAELWELTKASAHALQEDPLEKSAREMEKLRKAAETQAKAATSLAKRFPPRLHMPLGMRLRRRWGRWRRRGHVALERAKGLARRRSK
jgi:hypothetical protein